jgi:hypothetical protein
MLNGDEWANVKRAGAALPAGQVTPSPKPFHPDGRPLKVLEREKWTLAIKRVATFAQAVAYHVLEINVLDVTIANDVGWGFGAAYGERHLTLNLGRLGHQWFEKWPDNPDVERLLIHEFAHHYREQPPRRALPRRALRTGREARAAREAAARPLALVKSVDHKDLLRTPATEPASARQRPGTLGKGEPECGECGGPLDDTGFCPSCQPGDDEFEIDI